MNDGIRRFRELLLTDEAFQEKLKAAADAYTGEQDEEAVFRAVLAPLGKEYGIDVSFEEFLDYMKERSSKDGAMNDDELRQIAAGDKGSGFGASACLAIGIGLGGAQDDTGGVGCVVVGAGNTSSACAGEGSTIGGQY